MNRGACSSDKDYASLLYESIHILHKFQVKIKSPIARIRHNDLNINAKYVRNYNRSDV